MRGGAARDVVMRAVTWGSSRPWRDRLRRLACLWPLALDGLLLGAVAAGDELPIVFDAPALAGWSALIVGVGFLSGWIAHRALTRLDADGRVRAPS